MFCDGVPPTKHNPMTATHVQCRVLRYLAVALALATAVLTTPAAFAQVVSSGMTGAVRDSAGSPVAGAIVTATHVPTGTSYTATTTSTGRYNMRGMIVGGPYTVVARAGGYQVTQQTDVTTALGTQVDVNFSVESTEVVSMEAFTVQADTNELDSSSFGAANVLSSERLQLKPTTERSLADMVSASPLVTLRSTFGDREESQITALGQNNRFNSIQIDGSRINDQFGLNGTGLASFFNPLSFEWVDQLAVSVSPYDVRQAGFTGASINAVTKSGTNEFHGGVSYFFRGDSLGGIQLQGYNAREETLTGAKINPVLDRSTYEIHVGGPILRDRLFFFVGYEKFESASAGRDPRFAPAAEQLILSRLNQYSSNIQWGDPVQTQTSNVSEDEKKIAKLDWSISDQHRMSVRYLTAEGEVPQFGTFGNATVTNYNSQSGGISSAPTGHFYAQGRKEESVAAQIFSDWTPDFKTEFRYATTSQDQLTPVNSVAPSIAIFGLQGTDLNTNAQVTNGVYIAGTEQFRHGNVINVDTDQYYGAGDYFWRDWVFTVGVEREESDFYNLFRAGSYGLVAFTSLQDFLNDTGAIITRNVYDPNVRPVADISNFATTGIFANAKWDPTPRLSLTAGVRYEFAESDLPPALNTRFQQITGFRNDGTLDGADSISPRVGFNLALDNERRLQLRGGLGHFLGRAPWVIFSNSYGQTGVGAFTLDSRQGELPNSFSAYLAQFDASNPIGTGTDRPTLRREINWVDGNIELPQVWRGNIAVDYKLNFLDSTVTAELVHTTIDQALFITNENLRPTTVGADGRQRFAGTPATPANARYSEFTQLYRISNTSAGESTYFALQWERPIKNKWGFNLAYVHGSATEAQAIGQTTAGGQFQRNVVFNQNTVEEGTADFEVKHRVQFSLSKRFEFVRKAPTVISLYYEGRSGNPFSYVYTNWSGRLTDGRTATIVSGDLNNDGAPDNDAVAVPSGVDDPRFDFSQMSSADIAAYLALMERTGLSAYAGGIAPKNAFNEPWINRLDLHFEQIVPTGGRTRLKLFFDFVNLGSFISKSFFGYNEISPLVSNDVFRRRSVGAASYGPDGRIRPYYNSTRTPPAGFASVDAAPQENFNIDNNMSRWRIQVGAKFEF
jgi:hypothetical protein